MIFFYNNIDFLLISKLNVFINHYQFSDFLRKKFFLNFKYNSELTSYHVSLQSFFAELFRCGRGGGQILFPELCSTLNKTCLQQVSISKKIKKENLTAPLAQELRFLRKKETRLVKNSFKITVRTVFEKGLVKRCKTCKN